MQKILFDILRGPSQAKILLILLIPGEMIQFDEHICSKGLRNHRRGMNLMVFDFQCLTFCCQKIKVADLSSPPKQSETKKAATDGTYRSI